MKIGRVFLFPHVRGNVSENEIKAVEEKLSAFGISHTRDENGEYDAVIALGGDGTMLNAASVAFKRDVPIMSINFGTLGYMSGLENGELDMLEKLKSGFDTEDRMLIEAEVVRGGNTVAKCTSLNEVVISRSTDGDIAHLELKCDGAKVCDYRADGIIVATPTGSSAYNMSAGGPIIDTKLNAMCVCPICPHAMGGKALVFSPNSSLEIIVYNSDGNDILLCDGRKVSETAHGDIIKIKKSERTLKLIKLKKDAFYETLYKKLS